MKLFVSLFFFLGFMTLACPVLAETVPAPKQYFIYPDTRQFVALVSTAVNHSAQPYFVWSFSKPPSVAGWYAIMSNSPAVDPYPNGIFVGGPVGSTLSPKLTQSATYYLNVRAEDMNHNLSAIASFPYHFEVPSYPQTQPRVLGVAIASPVINRLSPNRIKAAKSWRTMQTIVLHGTDFSAKASVKIGSYLVSSVKVANPTAAVIKFQLSKLPAGKYNVTITNSGGQTVTLANGLAVTK